MKRFLIAAAALAFAAWSLPATAEEKTRPLKGDAPPEKKAAKPGKKAARSSLFDASALGKRDKASDAAAELVWKRCFADPNARQGATPETEKRCNAAAARLVAKGKKAAPSIFAVLNKLDGPGEAYEADRLLLALAKMDNDEIRKVTVEGYGRLTRREFEGQRWMAWEIPYFLNEMMGAGPDEPVPWEPRSVTDSPEEIRRDAARWKAFVTANEDKTRKEIVAEQLAKARKEKADDNVKKAYRAISFLIGHDAEEARKAARAYSKRRGLKEDVAYAFEQLGRVPQADPDD